MPGNNYRHSDFLREKREEVAFDEERNALRLEGDGYPLYPRPEKTEEQKSSGKCGFCGRTLVIAKRTGRRVCEHCYDGQ